MKETKRYIIRSEDCRKTIKHMKQNGIKVDCVITSPPYNISRSRRTGDKQRQLKNREKLYKCYDDTLNWNKYEDFLQDVLSGCLSVLKKDGVILLNMSYATNVETGATATKMLRTILNICFNLQLEVADIVCWKKKNALPNNRNKNKCTRICEYIFVLCREKEYCTFKSNKREIQGKVYTSYSNMFNYFEAKNNDGKNEYNGATFSIEMVANLLNMYVRDNSTVYDPFAGTCTTAVACKMENRNIKCICSEIDKEQCEYGKERLLNGYFF